MPVPATRLADVGVADPDPAVALRVAQHVLDEGAVGVLDGVALAKVAAGLLDAVRECVTDLLELTEVENPGTAAWRVDPPLEALARPGGGEELGEIALEVLDLGEQRATGATLVGRLGAPYGWRVSYACGPPSP